MDRSERPRSKLVIGGDFELLYAMMVFFPSLFLARGDRSIINTVSGPLSRQKRLDLRLDVKLPAVSEIGVLPNNHERKNP